MEDDEEGQAADGHIRTKGQLDIPSDHTVMNSAAEMTSMPSDLEKPEGFVVAVKDPEGDQLPEVHQDERMPNVSDEDADAQDAINAGSPASQDAAPAIRQSPRKATKRSAEEPLEESPEPSHEDSDYAPAPQRQGKKRGRYPKKRARATAGGAEKAEKPKSKSGN